ncbi:MAG: ABC transporter permease [Nitrospirota bacterium]|nr:ABC transporter permease [Nitrospirota bacterium]MDH5585132.1 ABC transporter permease [Nitrospirota bacterium]MDH5774024.1 ABC transporter permease [Nitrospirota bacterium]
MQRSEHPLPRFLYKIESVGRVTTQWVEALGFGTSLFSQSIFWICWGGRRKQQVRLAPIVAQMLEVGILALPIISLVSITIGLMLAIQGIDALKDFGAEHQVTFGVSLSVVREFAPLITGILVAGRSGSAFAARLSTMMINNEIDALRVMGINPVRFLVVPSLVAMMIMVPSLTLWADLIALLGAGLYITTDLGISMGSYVTETVTYLGTDDVLHGLGKSLVFGVLITLVGVVNGSSVSGGAEGVGQVTTQAVVHSILAIILADLLIVFLLTR